MRPHLIALVAVVTLLLTACGSPPAAQAPTAPAPTEAPAAAAPVAAPGASDPLRIITPFLGLPDPAKGGGFNAVQFGVGETLLRLDETFTPVPWLASELTPVTAGGAANRGSYRNAEVEAAIAALQPVTDRAERLEQSCAISQQLLDDAAIIPLVYPNYNLGGDAQ